jgi:hypothetical protein
MLMVNYYEYSYPKANYYSYPSTEENFQIPASSSIAMLLIAIVIHSQLYVKFSVSAFMKHEGEIIHHQQI